MNKLLQTISKTIFFILFLICVSPYSFSQKPNIVLVLADDLGYGDIQFFNSESKIPTPNIDKLAESGISFTNAHAPASVCTPTRYSILTGKYPWRSKRKKGVSWVWEGPMFEDSEATMAGMLRDFGYKTACIGKWHLGMVWPTLDGLPATVSNEGRNVDYSSDIMGGPIDRGFDYYFGQTVPGFPPHGFIENKRLQTFPSDWFDRTKNSNGIAFGISGAMSPGWEYDQLLTRITDRAIEWVKEQANDNTNPFFLYFPLTAPHTPIVPADDFSGKTEVGKYGDFVFEMDFHVGRLLKTLEELNISENTIVIFTSDNGPLNSDESGIPGTLIEKFEHNSSAGLRGMKSDVYEGGHRVPFIFKWPYSFKKEFKTDALISQVDIRVTLASLLNIPTDEYDFGDGYDLSPILYGEAKEVRSDLVSQSGNGVLSVQNRKWKLILSSGGGGNWLDLGDLPIWQVDGKGNVSWRNIQLYKIAGELTEQTNLSAKKPRLVHRMMRRLKEIILKNIEVAPAEKLSDKIEIWEEVKWMNALD